MTLILIALVALLAEICLGLVLTLLRKGKPATDADKPQRTTTKRVVWLCLGNGIAWVWCSYLLAYLGRAEIAESLSKVAITEIIGVVLIYCLKSLAENLSKNNNWPDKPVGTAQQDCD